MKRAGKARIFRASLLLTALLSISLAATPALADPPPGKGKPDKSQKQGGKQKGDDDSASSSSAALVSAGISIATARQMALDTGYKAGSYKPLPPGIQKNLARGKPLPPGIAKRSAPSGMIGRLPRHAGYEWQVAGTDLVLVQVGTAIVSDVLRGVFN